MGWQNGIARTGNQFALPQGVRLGILPVEPECPVDAIKPDTEPGLEKWLVLNREYAERWPNITA